MKTSLANRTSEELFADGVSLFNEEEFFECHEVLEALWNREEEPNRQFTQGLIQIAVAIYHLLRGNEIGALKLLPRGLGRIANFKPTYRSIDTAKLCVDVESLLSQIKAGSVKDQPFHIPKLELVSGC